MSDDDDPQKQQLEPLDLERLLRTDAQLRLALLAVETRRLQFQIESMQFTQQLTGLQTQADQANAVFQAFVAAIEAKYGIVMKDWGYESETGALTCLANN